MGIEFKSVLAPCPVCGDVTRYELARGVGPAFVGRPQAITPWSGGCTRLHPGGLAGFGLRKAGESPDVS